MTEKDVFIDLDTGEVEDEVEPRGASERRYVMLPSADEDYYAALIADNSEGIYLTEAQMNRLLRLWEER